MTKAEKTLIFAIAERAEKLNLLMFDRMSLIMDITSAHEEFNLRLSHLLSADDLNFSMILWEYKTTLTEKQRKCRIAFYRDMQVNSPLLCGFSCG